MRPTMSGRAPAARNEHGRERRRETTMDKTIEIGRPPRVAEELREAAKVAASVVAAYLAAAGVLVHVIVPALVAAL